jgi:serine/threonine protein kinase
MRFPAARNPRAASVFPVVMASEDRCQIGVGCQLGPYRIDALVGCGGMGIVYRAHDSHLQRTVAIKLVDRRRANDTSRRWLLHEARVAAALNHPGICGVHEVGYLGDQPFIVMEYVEGTSLGSLIPPNRGFAYGTALHYATQIADAVAYAHRRGIVHRDLKSSNFVITGEGRTKLLDFGLALRSPDAGAGELDTTCPHEIPSGAGTVPYMSPELLRGRPADRRSDVWALGVLVYEMVSGRRPFAGATRYELAAAILGAVPAPLGREVSPAMRQLVSRCLAKEPDDRYPCARALSAALDDLLVMA